MKMYPGATWEYTPTMAHMSPFEDTETNLPFVRAGDNNFGAEPLFKSAHAIALVTDKMTIGGLGRLPHGTIMAACKGGARNGTVFPHELAVPLKAGTSAGAKTVIIADEHAAIFNVGDAVQVREGAGAWEAVGVIEGVSSANGATTLTVSTASTNALTTAGFVTFVNDGPVCVLDTTVVTGVSGAYASVAFSNMVLYSSQLKNSTEAALTAMNAVQDGVYTIFK